MPITKHDKQALEQMHSDWSGKYKGRTEDYFALLYLTKTFKCDVEEIAHEVCFGGCDYGIDAYHIDRKAGNLYLFQFKWSESHNLFAESMERLAADGLGRVFGSNLADPNENELLNTLRSELRECKKLIDRVYVRFVFKGELEATEKSEGLDYRRENIENKSHLVHTFFGRSEVELIVEFVADRLPPPTSVPNEAHTISFTGASCIRSEDGKREMHVGFVPMMDLYRIFRSLGKRFLNRNIRSGLSADNPPNRKIREALNDIVLKQKTSPDVFCFNHNGVTLAAERLQIIDGRTVIYVPRLLNGAQTITSVVRFLEDNEGHPALQNGAPNLEAIKLLAKIVIDDPSSDFVTQVTICNNQQNPVAAWNLRANDRIQCDLHDFLKDQVRVFYSRQENAYRSYEQKELEEMGYDATVLRDIQIKPLAQTFQAIQGEIARMSKPSEVFENQTQYEQTFKESYLHCDARKIVLAYKVGLVLNHPIQRLEELASQKIRIAVRKAKNLIWALLIQGLFNDPKLSNLLEEYGTMKKEHTFTEYLRKLAASRVLPILKDVLAKPEHAEKMSNEKYDFLRTKEIFNQCKDAAYERFNWKKMSI